MLFLASILLLFSPESVRLLRNHHLCPLPLRARALRPGQTVLGPLHGCGIKPAEHDVYLLHPPGLRVCRLGRLPEYQVPHGEGVS